MRIAIAMIASLVAVPASAQFWGGTSDGELPRPLAVSSARHPGILQQSEDAIRTARSEGRITRDEARDLRREKSRIAAVGHRLGRDGLSPAEQRELEQQALILKGLIEARLARKPAGG